MISTTTKRFWLLHDALPQDVQERARKAYDLFSQDPSHTSLQFKRVGKRRPIYSARIDHQYRVLGQLKGDTIKWFWIGSHDEYDRLLKSL